jgi:hypothetical protein
LSEVVADSDFQDFFGGVFEVNGWLLVDVCFYVAERVLGSFFNLDVSFSDIHGQKK